MKLSLTLLILTFPLTVHATATIIKIDGSSTVYPITEAIAENFQSLKKDSIQVTVDISGTSGGFKKFCRGETDIQNASRPITKDEINICQKSKVTYFELPIGFDAIAIVVNTKNNWLNTISVEEMKKLWEPSAQNDRKKWKQINPKWPVEEFNLYGAGADSGTYDYFTKAIIGSLKSSRLDYAASEDDQTIALNVANDVNSFAFLPFSYYADNKAKLKLLSVISETKSSKKSPVFPSQKTVLDGTYSPLSRPIFLYVNANSYKKTEVKELLDFYMKNANEWVHKAGYFSLPKIAYQRNIKKLQENKVGTAFKGTIAIGLTVKQILKKDF